MGDFPTPSWPPFNTISTFSLESIGSILRAADHPALNAIATRTQIANTAYYYPFRLWEPATAVKMSYIVGGTQSGNVDVGIYDSQKNRLVNSGTTGQGAINTFQEIDITDTLLPPGVHFMAIQFSTTGTAFGSSSSDESIQAVLPMWQQAVGSFGLPNPAAWVHSVQGTVEYHGLAVHFDATT